MIMKGGSLCQTKVSGQGRNTLSAILLCPLFCICLDYYNSLLTCSISLYFSLIFALSMRAGVILSKGSRAISFFSPKICKDFPFQLNKCQSSPNEIETQDQFVNFPPHSFAFCLHSLVFSPGLLHYRHTLSSVFTFRLITSSEILLSHSLMTISYFLTFSPPTFLLSPVFSLKLNLTTCLLLKATSILSPISVTLP